MSTVLAAIDNSAAAVAVLGTAETIARRLGWRLEALHVREDGDVGARAAAAAAGVDLTEVEGSPTEQICDLARAEDVVALVVGARSFAAADVLGGTAVELVTAVDKPVVVVPPEAPPIERLSRILLPLDASEASAEALNRGLELLTAADVELVVLHVEFGDTLPMFEDQCAHETDAWIAEFLRRYCPVAPEGVRLELRTGRPGEHVVDVAVETGAELIALGWRQKVATGRAAVVREVLTRSRLPVVLFPVPKADPEAG
jgi:nucleotide-binding universal stress UspA family protein